eukprot:354159-Chlamydomonas_euryale.AAC.1
MGVTASSCGQLVLASWALLAGRGGDVVGSRGRSRWQARGGDVAGSRGAGNCGQAGGGDVAGSRGCGSCGQAREGDVVGSWGGGNCGQASGGCYRQAKGRCCWQVGERRRGDGASNHVHGAMAGQPHVDTANATALPQ